MNKKKEKGYSKSVVVSLKDADINCRPDSMFY